MVKVLGFWGSRFKAQVQGASGGCEGACLAAAEWWMGMVVPKQVF